MEEEDPREKEVREVVGQPAHQEDSAACPPFLELHWERKVCAWGHQWSYCGK